MGRKTARPVGREIWSQSTLRIRGDGDDKNRGRESGFEGGGVLNFDQRSPDGGPARAAGEGRKCTPI
ncbi:unnamed protein product [Cuscuta epithymum]|uniref:Uncharacterized protein n=1 Tax=Cuscuta epithymum TaxID=186058 RepID=A0AAV0FXC9_9ASTE|nr:unnamed protein product [Cuscuta epithymum]